MSNKQILEIKKLKLAEDDFLRKYPGGFENPEMLKVGKKHKMDKMVELAQSCFDKKACNDVDKTAENMVKVINRSSMVSLFEKPKFRDFVKILSGSDKAFLVKSLYQLLHGKQELGFQGMVDLLKTQKLAKWSLVTIIPAYFYPDKEVFVKPTTAKNVIRHFEVENLIYKPAPTWSFYTKYRDLINQSKQKIDKGLSPSNAAFCGFLMMMTQINK